MNYTSVTALLLQAAISLLLLVQANPQLDASFRQQAIAVATQALKTATEQTGVMTTTSAPTTTILSPNGGENYTVGENIPIRWHAPSFIQGGLYMELVDSLGRVVSNDITGLGVGGPHLNDFNGSYTLDTTGYPTGQYKIHIATYGKDPSPIGDSSDFYFTITTPETVADQTISARMGNLRAEAELFYDINDGSYAGFCQSDTALMDDVDRDNGAALSIVIQPQLRMLQKRSWFLRQITIV